MGIHRKLARGPWTRSAFLGALLLTRLADAQIATATSSPGLSPLSDAAAFGAPRPPPYSYGIDAGVGETDNVTLSSTDKISQTLAIVDTDFTVNERSRLFDVNAAGNFSYLDYLQNAYGGQLLGRFDGTADAAIVPGRLVWVLRDDFGQAALDPYTPVTPNNLENINYLATGPDLKLRLGALDFFELTARYARAQYQTSPFNNDRLLGGIALGRDVSAGGSVSLDANTEHVRFDNTTLNADFERSSGFGRYEVHGARTDFVGELGVTLVNQSAASSALIPVDAVPGSTSAPGAPLAAGELAGAGSSKGPLAKLELSRAISASAKITLRAGRDLTDTSSSFSNQTIGAVPVSNSVAPAPLSAASYRVTYASAGWQYMRNRTTLSATGRWEKDVYPGLPSLDLTVAGADARIERRLTRTLSAQLFDTWNKFDYPHAVLAAQVIGSTEYANDTVGGSLIWRHGRGLEVRLRADHDSYSAHTGNTGYRDTRAYLTVGYRPMPPESSQGP